MKAIGDLSKRNRWGSWTTVFRILLKHRMILSILDTRVKPVDPLLRRITLNLRFVIVMSKFHALPEVPRLSLVESALQLMRARIEDGSWKIGERIPKEAELAEMLQVGRNTVREAIRVLSHSEVLEVRQGDGTYVRSNVDPAETMRKVNQSRLRDHFELRALLETEAARLAATRRTKADLDDLTKLLRERGEPPRGNKLALFVDRDVAFHIAIAKASHNTALEELYRYFANSIRVSTHAVLKEHELPGARMASHQKIIDAIRKQDPDDAAVATLEVVTP